ncbi:MAG TPA: hypothetical protein VNL77_03180, partial [Roseiflexaceae bacterium]|nr:hypothetical protein [Roseiflexaceae bacterium]
IAHALRTDPERDVAAAKEALRRGDLEGALALSAHARLPATIAAWIRPWLPLGGAAVLALVLGASALAGVLWWRRPRRPRRPPRGKPPAPQDPSGRDLLAELLARPPGGGNDTA